jgi:hypothetical protein
MSTFSPKTIIIWILLPAINFYTWYYIAHSKGNSECLNNAEIASFLPVLPCPINYHFENENGNEKGISGYQDCQPVIHRDYEKINVEEIKTEDFDHYRAVRLAPMTGLKGVQCVILHFYRYMYVCVYMHVDICMYVYIYMYICVYIYE